MLDPDQSGEMSQSVQMHTEIMTELVQRRLSSRAKQETEVTMGDRKAETRTRTSPSHCQASSVMSQDKQSRAKEGKAEGRGAEES